MVKKELCRLLRKNMTEAETVFWHEFRNRKVNNLKFNRQFPVSFRIIGQKQGLFIVDFYCHQMKLVVEIDGPYHKKRIIQDLERDEILRSMGYKVVRFTNKEVLEDMDLVKKEVLKFLKS